MKKPFQLLSLTVFLFALSCTNEEKTSVDGKSVNESTIKTKETERREVVVPVPPPPPRPPTPKEVIKNLPPPPVPPPPPKPPRPGGG
jgi:hypothetical protein